MGHLAGKDIYKKLENKIDGLTIRTLSNKVLLILPQFCSVIVKQPQQAFSILFQKLQVICNH